MAEQWFTWFSELGAYLTLLLEKEASATSEEASDVIIKLDTYITILSLMIQRMSDENLDIDEEGSGLKQELTDMMESLRRVLSFWIDKEAGIHIRQSIVPYLDGILFQCYHPGRRGRPKFLLPVHTLQFLRELHFSWTKIACILGISRRTLFSIRQELGFEAIDPSAYSQISDHEIRLHIKEIKLQMPDAGIRMIRGILRSRGINIQIVRIRDMMYEVDPVGMSSRWATVVKRRVYTVKSPNALWHIDGNHKLVRWRMVVHGGVDGFSRFVVFLKCSTNNLSDTVLQLFKAAVREYGLPHQVRGDQGGENVKVAEYMLRHSTHDNPMLTGSSTHNQRIERLWRDVYRCVISVYYQLFYYLEECGRLDHLSDLDLYCLHLVYLPKINESLATFVDGWNCHALSTEHNLTPMQVFSTGSILSGGLSRTCVLDDRDNDHQAVSQSLVNPPCAVEVPSTAISLSIVKHAQLTSLLQSVPMDTNFNVDLYDTVKQIVYQSIV